MTHVIHRNLNSSYPTAVAGEGVYIIDNNGRRYLDACGGAAVCSLGYSDPEVLAAIKEQLAVLPYVHSSFFTTAPMEELASFLAARAPGDLDYVYFVSGGSEAVEAALKLARQYFVERDEPQRQIIIGRRQSYHGNTLGALSAGGNLWRRRTFEPLLIQCHHVSPCYSYRDQHEGESTGRYCDRLIGELRDLISRIGGERVIAFIAEPVVGATLGAVPAIDDYFARVRQLCNEHGILLILDEVMCGMGRTGTLFASEHDQVTADLICIAKGLGAGYQPIGAVIASDQIYRAVQSGSGFFQHGHTYIGHATACQAALTVQKIVERRQLLQQVSARSQGLFARLQERFRDHPFVGDIRGRGLFVGIELVADRPNKTPFAPSQAVASRLKTEALNQGLMCYPMSGTVDGRCGDHVLLAPPFVIDEDQLDELTDKLDVALAKVLPQ